MHPCDIQTDGQAIAYRALCIMLSRAKKSCRLKIRYQRDTVRCTLWLRTRRWILVLSVHKQQQQQQKLLANIRCD